MALSSKPNGEGPGAAAGTSGLMKAPSLPMAEIANPNWPGMP